MKKLFLILLFSSIYFAQTPKPGGTSSSSGSGSIPTNANLPGSPTTTTQTASDSSTKVATTSMVQSAILASISTCTFVTGAMTCGSSVSAGSGSGVAGALDILGTGGHTSTITVDNSNTASVIKLPNDATSGIYFTTVTTSAPASGCAHFTGTSTELATTGIDCGSSSGGGPSFASPYLINGTDSYLSPGPLVPPPSLASWTWTNQGSAAVSLVNNALLLTAPAQSGDSLRCFFSNQTYPTTPWATSWTVGVVSNFVGTNYFVAGLVISDGTKLQTFGVGQINNIGYTLANWNTTTSNSLANDVNFPLASVVYLTLNDDGTNIDFWVSNNFNDLKRLNVYHASRTVFLTPSKIGIFIDPNNSDPRTGGGSLMFVHWTGPVV